MTEESLSIVIHARLVAFLMTVERAKDIPLEVVSWLAGGEEICVWCKYLASYVIREMEVSIMVNEKLTTMKELRGGFVFALLSESCGIRGIALASHGNHET
jgi:hypothetical protein